MSTANEPAPNAEPASGADPEQQGTTFTQADVDRIVGDRVTRERAKYADYDELKSKAGTAATLEQRLGALETELGQSKAEALRSRVAAKFGISTEPGANNSPSDADLFLTGTDEASLTAQAERLAGRVADRKKQGNHAPKEGSSPSAVTDDSLRDFTKKLFNKE